MQASVPTEAELHDDADDGRAGGRGGVRGRTRALRELIDRPLTPYYLVVGITVLLLMLGLVMVLSTGSIRDLTNGQSPYADFAKQLTGVLVGIPVTWLAARASPRLFRAAAYPLLAISFVGLGLTLIHGVGQEVNGASRWIPIGPVQFQPSELAKLALAVWGADLLARKEKLGLTDWRHMLVPLMPVTGLLAMLVITGDDLSTTVIIVIIFLALLWVAGAPGRMFTLMLILMGLVLLLLIVAAPYRLERFTSFLNASPTSTSSGSGSLCPSNQFLYQGCEGKIALGSGGLFGVGLGAGGLKWGYVPEYWDDFIFAIIGEELGLVGTLCVVALYGALAYAGLRVARGSTDTFAKLAAAAITIWVTMQAVVNMGEVIGLLPVAGIPLPLVSEGLSSVLVTMVALGMLMSFARRMPGAREALAARGPGVSGHVLSWLGRDKRARSR